MNRFGLRFHHLGLAVRSPESASSFLTGLGYTQGRQVFDPLQGVNAAMRHHAEMPDVELIWPGEGPSPVDRLLKPGGAKVYHLCFASDRPVAALAALEATGVSVLTVVEATPAALFAGASVSFHYIDDLGLIEILHTSGELNLQARVL